MAIEFGPRGITSNVIAPGPIAGTEGMERLARKEDAAEGKKQIPLGRWGTVREIADATVYLFSEAAGYVNGTTLVGESELFPAHPSVSSVSRKRPTQRPGSPSFGFFVFLRSGG